MMAVRILILGLGSIGRRHATLLRQHFSHEVELVSMRTHMGQELNDLGIPEISGWDEISAQRLDVALITNPTNMHIDTAIRCAERGLHLFIEKPIDCRLDGLDHLLRIVAERRLTAYVAYPMRFHPVVRELKSRLVGRKILHANMVCASFLPGWRPNQDHLKGYSAYWARGGGVFLDMSHEIDMAQYLFGPVTEIEGTLGRVGGVTVDSDDSADILVSHEWGTTNIHLNSVSEVPRRYVEIDLAHGHLHGDVRRQTVTDWEEGRMSEAAFSTDGDWMYVEQLRYFLENLGRDDFENSLLRASGLYKKMIDFREARGTWTR